MVSSNEGSTFDRDDNALVDEPDALAGGRFSKDLSDASEKADDRLGETSGDPDAVGSTSPGSADTSVGGIDAAEAEFEASGGTADPALDDSETVSGDTGPSEPVDRFEDGESASVGSELTDVPSGLQPNTQGDDPIYAELGDEGQGDLSPEDQI